MDRKPQARRKITAVEEHKKRAVFRWKGDLVAQ